MLWIIFHSLKFKQDFCARQLCVVLQISNIYSLWFFMKHAYMYNIISFSKIHSIMMLKYKTLMYNIVTNGAPYSFTRPLYIINFNSKTSNGDICIIQSVPWYNTNVLACKQVLALLFLHITFQKQQKTWCAAWQT